MNRCARPSHRQVVIAKEEDGLELKQEVEVLRKNVETQKGLQHTQDPQVFNTLVSLCTWAVQGSISAPLPRRNRPCPTCERQTTEKKTRFRFPLCFYMLLLPSSDDLQPT